MSLEMGDALESSLTEEQLLLPLAAPKEKLSWLSSSVGLLVPLGSVTGGNEETHCFCAPVAFDAFCCS